MFLYSFVALTLHIHFFVFFFPSMKLFWQIVHEMSTIILFCMYKALQSFLDVYTNIKKYNKYIVYTPPMYPPLLLLVNIVPQSFTQASSRNEVAIWISSILQ